MIVTDHFVYIHVSRSGGTFLNKLIMEHVPGARMVQYHGHLRDLPAKFSELPVLGFVRNPWDWYVSMFFDYRRKRQYVLGVLSDRGKLGFGPTIRRFLTLGDDNEESKRLRAQLVQAAPVQISTQSPPPHHLPGLRSDHFAGFPDNTGYYSWLFQLMFETGTDRTLHIGRFENLREDSLRLLEEIGTPITGRMRDFLEMSKPLNASPRPAAYDGGYNQELTELVAEKDRYVIDRFGYTF
jgi:hypothetical protein